MSSPPNRIRLLQLVKQRDELQQIWDLVAGVQWRAQKAECEAANLRIDLDAAKVRAAELEQQLEEAHRYIQGLERELKLALKGGAS